MQIKDVLLRIEGTHSAKRMTGQRLSGPRVERTKGDIGARRRWYEGKVTGRAQCTGSSKVVLLNSASFVLNNDGLLGKTMKRIAPLLIDCCY